MNKSISNGGSDGGNVIKHIIDNDIDIFPNTNDNTTNSSNHDDDMITTITLHSFDNNKYESIQDSELTLSNNQSLHYYHTQHYCIKLKQWKCCNNDNQHSKGCKCGSIKRYHNKDIMTNNSIIIWPLVILLFILCSIFELIMKLLIFIMIFLLYIFKGKIEHLSNAFTFDTWNTFQYYTYPSNGKYACCYGLYGYDCCKDYVNEVKMDPVIDEVNRSLVFDKI
jgi:hypothetical protein